MLCKIPFCGAPYFSKILTVTVLASALLNVFYLNNTPTCLATTTYTTAKLYLIHQYGKNQ